MSTNPRIYLDFNATAPLRAEARAAMAEAMGETGNPSSIHAEGRRARDRVERARAHIAALLGRPREHVVFTSGGTEANALGVTLLAELAERRGLPKVVATTAIEHPSLLGAVRGLRGWDVRVLPPWSTDVAGAGLVATSVANHELGTLVSDELLAAARATGALVHLDAVQAAGKRALPDADALAISAHKLGGPQGIGAVALPADAVPATEAGHQERGRRAGTENTIGIVGFGAAVAAIASPGSPGRAATRSVAESISLAGWSAVVALGDRLEAGLRAIPDTRIHGADRPRIGGTINAGFAGARGESIVIALDLAGVAVSTGAACTSGTLQPSPVLLALGLTPDQALEAVRFSLGHSTTAAEIDRVLELLPPIVERARRFR